MRASLNGLESDRERGKKKEVREGEKSGIGDQLNAPQDGGKKKLFARMA